MQIPLDQHRGTLIKEYKLQEDEFRKILSESAFQLRETGKLYVAQLAGFDELRGNVILRLSSKRPFPRKNEHLTALVPAKIHNNPANWQSTNYEQIRGQSQRFCELVPVWFRLEENGRMVIGFRGATTAFLDKLTPNTTILLGPQEPPTDYLKNLIYLLENAPLHPRFQETVGFDSSHNDWQPEPLPNNQQTSLRLLAELTLHSDIIIQGPPGTGKSFLIANLCADFLRQGKRVLVTALTNTALMELADKEGLAGSIKAGKVYKTSLTTDESKRIPKLKDGNEFDNQPATLLLATYYKMSQRAKEAAGVQFDLVIVEEASQAFLATIGAARLLGQHCLIVGDQMQLQPIRLLNDEDLDVPYLQKIFNGLHTVAISRFASAKFILETTFRLTPFNTYLTNAFYGDRLKAEQKTETRLNYPVGNEIPFSQRTVHVVELPISVGIKTPGNAIAAITQLTGQLHRLNPKASIAVLSFYVVTVKELQRSISEEVVHSEHVMVETIDRIQGLTVDVCLWLIPNTGLNFSLNPHRFNVATSRARCQTIVFMPNSFAANSIDPLVNAWLNRYRQSTEA